MIDLYCKGDHGSFAFFMQTICMQTICKKGKEKNGKPDENFKGRTLILYSITKQSYL